VSRNSRSAILIACFILTASLATSLLSAAQALPPASSHSPDKPPDKQALDSILLRLDQNIEDFNETIPTFFSREEVVSEQEPGLNGVPSTRTNTSSTFIVRRADDPNDPNDPANDSYNPTEANQLHESRIVKTIDEKGFIKPEKGAKMSDTAARMDSSYVIFGIFSGGMTRISTPGKACFHYHLHPERKRHNAGRADRIVIDFESWPRKDRGVNCPYSDRISGRGFIDAASMQLVRLENTEHDDKGTWNWSVDYAPIPLNGKTFWLPTTIRSEDIASADAYAGFSGSLTTKTVTHRLVARYSRYRQPKLPSHPAPEH
jgi:hypothetical protein